MANRLQMRDRTLLLHSEVIKQFPEILQIIEENVKITDELISNLTEDKKNFFDNILNQVLKQAISEWKGDPEKIEDTGPDPSKRKRCSLENNPNRYIFYINNKLNGTSLNVGSECINHFWGSWGSNFEGKTMAQLKRDAGRLRLLSDLNDKIPGIGRIIDRWNLPVSDCEIILPRSLEKPYLDLGKQASIIFENYLCEKEHGDYENQLRNILEQRNILVSEIEEYVLRKSPEKYIPKKEVRSWLRSNRLVQVLDMLIDDGEITWRTAYRIEEPSFMKSIMDEINHGMKDLGLRVVSLDVARRGYVLETIGNDKVQLFSKHHDLIFYCGWLLFSEKPIEEFSRANTIQRCKLNSEADIDAVLRGLKYITSKFEIELEDADYESEEVAIFDNKTGKYVLSNFKELTEEFKGLVIGAKDKTDADLKKYIENIPGKRYSKVELEDLRRMREVHNIRKY